jgi:two-component system, response regulator YesN
LLNPLHLLIRKRAFWHIYITISLFIFLSIAIVAFLFYSLSTKKLSQEYNRNNLMMLHQSSVAMDTIVDAIFYNANQFYQDKNFLNLMRQMEQQSEPFIRGQIIQELDRFQGGSKHVDSVVLYLKNSESILSTEYGYTPLNEFPNSEFIESSRRLADDLHLVARKIIPQKTQQDSGSILLTLLKKIPYSKTDEAILIVNLDVNKIYEGMVSNIKSDSGASLLAVDETGNLLLNGGNTPIVNELLSNKDFRSFIQNIEAKEQLTNIAVKGHNYLIASVYSDYLGVKFIWVSSKDQLYEVYKSLRNLNIVNSLLALLILWLFAAWHAQRVTRPMDDLLQVVDSTMMRKRNIFEGIGKAVKEIVTSNEVLKRKLDSMLPLYQKNFLQSLLTAQGALSPDTIKGMDEYSIILHHDYIYIVVLEFIGTQETMERDQVDSVYLFALEEMLDQTMKYHKLDGYKANMDNRKYALIINVSESDESEGKRRILNFLKQLLQHVSEHLPNDMAVGVSRRQSSVFHLPEQYQECLRAIQYRTIDDANPILFADEVYVEEKRSESPFIPLEEKLEMYMNLGQAEKANELVAEAFEGMKNKTAEQFHEQMMILMSIFLKLTDRIQIDLRTEMKVKEHPLELLANIQTIREAQSLFNMIIQTICAITTDRRKSLEHSHLSKIISYIDSNYSEDLSIDMLSQKVNISPSYIFKIIREHTQTTFTEYITHKRMEKACELLQTNMKVQDIALQVGYSTSKYFIQVFKKMKGITPNDYRKMHASGPNGLNEGLSRREQSH